VLDGGRTFTIPLDRVPTSTTAYGLREPPGIAIDVAGAALEGGASSVEVGSNAVRLVKGTPRRDGSGTRIVVYLRARALPRYVVAADGARLRVTIEQ
jgi:hypothetical protein